MDDKLVDEEVGCCCVLVCVGGWVTISVSVSVSDSVCVRESVTVTVRDGVCDIHMCDIHMCEMTHSCV